jgi:multiple sugar transport system permease protein
LLQIKPRNQSSWTFAASGHAFTLPTVFCAVLGFQAAQYGEASALSATSLVPLIILGMLVQRHLVRGLTLGAVHG